MTLQQRRAAISPSLSRIWGSTTLAQLEIPNLKQSLTKLGHAGDVLRSRGRTESADAEEMVSHLRVLCRTQLLPSVHPSTPTRNPHI